MNKKYRIIALCGQRRSGKDTIADIFVENWGYEKIKIASKLKKIIQILFNFSDSQMEDSHKDSIDENWNISPRQAMQFFGTEIMQFKLQELLPSVGRLFFIKSLIDEHINTGIDNKLIISDLRFVHEWNLLKKYNCYIIKVERDNNDISDTHISETELEKIEPDLIIKNNENIDSLKKNIFSIFLTN